ncbi:MAG TPA: ankyrin repeat domain-containing protein [Planctomycetota bacterium]|nr:ankyrin repeat domain-containing protein [Planctomycetota bacterium]
MIFLSTEHPLAVAAVKAIHGGDVAALGLLLVAHPELATVRLGDDDPCGMSRTLLHVVTDWPGHFPNGAVIVKLLARAGADVDARFRGPHEETPLHWAASCNDVAVLDALLDAGADIEAPGSVLGGGPPLSDATGFAQWDAARRLVQRGAHTTLADQATLGLMEALEHALANGKPPAAEIHRAFWGACHGGQRAAAELLLGHGADINWLPGWERATPLDAARRNGFEELAQWLGGRGGTSAKSSGEPG